MQYQSFIEPITNQPAKTDTPEMFVGSHPDRSRQWLPVRLGWSTSQTTFDPAPFSEEMVVGSHPDRARPTFVSTSGWQVSQTTFNAAPFSEEMVQGYNATAGKRFTAPRIQPIFSPDVILFGIESTLGSHPDRNRVWLPLRTGWQTPPVTNDQAVFSDEMIQGSRPTLGRPPFIAKLGSQVFPITNDQAPFSPEMVIGWHPDFIRHTFGQQGFVFSLYDGIIPGVPQGGGIGASPFGFEYFGGVPNAGALYQYSVSVGATSIVSQSRVTNSTILVGVTGTADTGKAFAQPYFGGSPVVTVGGTPVISTVTVTAMHQYSIQRLVSSTTKRILSLFRTTRWVDDQE